MTVTYDYDERDRVTKVDSSNYLTVTYDSDGDGNLVQRSDSTGVVGYDFDPLNRETVRTLQDGSQTILTYTPAGNVDTYEDPSGLTDYTWDAVHNLTKLETPAGKVTTYEYDNNDVRKKTTYPGGTVQEVTLDESSRPERIKATSPKGTLIDLTYSYAYSGANANDDGGKIRTSTNAVTGMKTSYTYDGAGRFSYAKEEKGTTLNSSWQYCYDLAGNLTSQGVDTGLYHYEARYYDPNIGRFTSPDPSGQEKNPYLYAEGDPVNKMDPSGLSGGFNSSWTVCSAGRICTRSGRTGTTRTPS